MENQNQICMYLSRIGAICSCGAVITLLWCIQCIHKRIKCVENWPTKTIDVICFFLFFRKKITSTIEFESGNPNEK